MSDISQRKALTFEQAEGLAPLPQQLKTGEVSQELRVRLWSLCLRFFSDPEWDDGYQVVQVPFRWILCRYHMYHLSRFEDEFDPKNSAQQKFLKNLVSSGTYAELLGFVQFILRDRQCPPNFAKIVDFLLEDTRSAYRVIDGDTIAPLSDPIDAESITKALAALGGSNFHGARQHLKGSVEALSAGLWPDAVREAVHAVESVARMLAPEENGLGPALSALEKKGHIHEALKKGFGQIYGFTSDEKGIRHALLDTSGAAVDEADALFMLGACSAFVSYLLNKARVGGIDLVQQDSH